MNFEDDLAKDVEAAMNSVPAESSPGGDAAPPADAPAVASSSVDEGSAGERARGADGKFIPKDVKPAGNDQKPVAAPETATAAQPQASQPVAAIPAPAHWKGTGKVEWARLPQHVQKHIADDYAAVQTTQGELSKLKSAIGEQRLQQFAMQYGSPEQGLQSILAGADMANKNPLGFIQWLAQRSGIDLARHFGQQGGQGQQPAAPDHPVMQELATLRSTIQQLTQNQQQSQAAPILAEVERFRNDPANPYYNDVEPHIIALLKSGTVQGSSPSERLKNAYNEACWANSSVREQLLTAERKKFTDAQAAKVQQAKQASGSLTGSPQGAKTPDDTPDEDLEQTVARLVNAR